MKKRGALASGLAWVMVVALAVPHHSALAPFHAQVLENKELIDKTLLFNVKLIRVDAADANGGFTIAK